MVSYIAVSVHEIFRDNCPTIVHYKVLPMLSDLCAALLPASFPLAIIFVATSLMVLCEGPDEVIVVTRQAFSESQ